MALEGVPIYKFWSSLHLSDEANNTTTKKTFMPLSLWKLKQMCDTLPIPKNYVGFQRAGNGNWATNYTRYFLRDASGRWLISTRNKVKARIKEERLKQLILGLAKVE